MKIRTYILFLSILITSCSQEEKETTQLFHLLSEEETGISFRNDLAYTEQVNPYTFRNFYNGVGVALGDINQGGLIDIFLAENQIKLKPELGSRIGGFSWINQKPLKNNWKVLISDKSGIYVSGEIRDILSVQIKNENHLLFLRNNENTIAFKVC